MIEFAHGLFPGDLQLAEQAVGGEEGETLLPVNIRRTWCLTSMEIRRNIAFTIYIFGPSKRRHCKLNISILVTQVSWQPLRKVARCKEGGFIPVADAHRFDVTTDRWAWPPQTDVSGRDRHRQV